MYWIAGSVEDPDQVGTAGRQVVFFKTLENNQVTGGYADDLVGTAGLAGRADEYMLNAYEDYRLVVAPGTYYAAIVNDNPNNPSEGYGANPVEVNLTGQGYDIANLVLEKGAGILPPPVAGVPIFKEVRYGNRLYQPTLVAKGMEFVVSEQPKITTVIASDTGLNTSQIFMTVNPNTADSMQISFSEATTTSMVGPSAAPTEVTFVYDFVSAGKALADGENIVNFSAANAAGTAVYDSTVSVMGGEGRLIGIPLTYPSPVHLKTDKEVTVQYSLSKDMNVDIFFFDVSGRMVKKFTLYSREEGGSAGINKVTWNLITDQGQIVSSGIYLFTIVNRDDNKLLGKGKFTALP
jgi:hypothetical protein